MTVYERVVGRIQGSTCLPSLEPQRVFTRMEQPCTYPKIFLPINIFWIESHWISLIHVHEICYYEALNINTALSAEITASTTIHEHEHPEESLTVEQRSDGLPPDDRGPHRHVVQATEVVVSAAEMFCCVWLFQLYKNIPKYLVLPSHRSLWTPSTRLFEGFLPFITTILT